MAKKPQKDTGPGEEKERAPGLYAVRPTAAARRESRVGKGLFQGVRELQRVLDLLKLLRHWPPDLFESEAYGRDLDIEKVAHGGVEFYYWRMPDPGGRGRELRVFFWADDANKTIWVIHGMWKKSQELKLEVKVRVARRIRESKGSIQDQEHGHGGR